MDIEQRKLQAINELALAPKGSLWIIKEAVWEQVIPDYQVKRKGHPALVFANKKYKTLLDTVPIMMGSSKEHIKNRGFQVRNVMPNVKNKTKYTYFTVIRPRPVYYDFKEGNALGINEFAGNNPDICRNEEKRNLDAEEMERLDTYLQERGLHL